MREEYADREVAVEAIRPLLTVVQHDADHAQLMAEIDGGRERISWDEFCALLDVVAEQSQDPRAFGAQVINSALYKFQRRARLAGWVLTLEDALAFMLYPRNPIDFACINSAITHQPGRVDVVTHIVDRYHPHPTFYQLMLGAAEAFLPLLQLDDARVEMAAQGRQAHFVFTYTPRDSWRSRMRRLLSRTVFSLYSIAIIRSSYPYLVQGRKMFEEQLIERAKIETLPSRATRFDFA